MERKNTGWKILTLLLFIALLGTSGFITYDKVLKDKYFTKKDDNKEEKKEKNNTDNKTADELYAEYLENLKENIDKTYNEQPTDFNSREEFDEFMDNNDVYNYGNYTTYTVGDSNIPAQIKVENGTLFVSLSIDNSWKDFEIDKNVLQFFVSYNGNSGMQYLYYIKEDGNLYVSAIESLRENVTSPKKTALKNIVGVIPSGFGFMSGWGEPIFIDIEGTLFRIDENEKAIQLNVE